MSETSERMLGFVCSDTHLENVTWKKHPELCGDSFRAFEFIVTKAIANRAPLIIPGDIFELAKPNSEAVAFFCGQMDRCAAERIPVYFIQGNHDYALPPWPLVHSWPTWIHRKTIHLGPGVTVYGIDYTPRDKLQAELDLIPDDTNIVLMHQAWDELQGVGATDGSLNMVPHGELIITGDYHVRLTKSLMKPDGLGADCFRVHSPGSICMQALDEPPQKFATMLTAVMATLDTNAVGSIAIRDVPLPCRPFYDLKINTPEELEQAIISLSNPIEPGTDMPIVRLRFSDALENAYDRLEAACGGRYHVFPEPQHPAIEQVAVQVEGAETSAANFDTLETGLQAMHQQGAIDDETYNIAVRLLRAGAELPREPQRIFDELRSAPAAAPAAEVANAPQVVGATG